MPQSILLPVDLHWARASFGTVKAVLQHIPYIARKGATLPIAFSKKKIPTYLYQHGYEGHAMLLSIGYSLHTGSAGSGSEYMASASEIAHYTLFPFLPYAC